MTESNPYATPKAELRGPGTTPGRPRWTWVILIFNVFGAVGIVFSYYLLFSGALSIPEEQKRYLADMTILDHVLSFIIVGINLVAAVQLFRLRRISVYLFPAALAFGVVLTAWNVATKGWLAATGGSGASSLVFGWGIAVVICLYTWRLAKRGILK